MFPVDLAMVDGNDAASRGAAVIPHLEVFPVGGDHFTMLQPPYVGGLANVVAHSITAAAEAPTVQAVGTVR